MANTSTDLNKILDVLKDPCWKVLGARPTAPDGKVMDLLVSHLTVLRHDITERKEDIEEQLSNLLDDVSTIGETRPELTGAMAAVDSRLKAAFATPVSNMGQAPDHKGSWIGPISGLQKDIQKLGATLSDMYADADSIGCPSANPIKTQHDRRLAERYLRRHPPRYGDFPSEATRAMFADVIGNWTDMLFDYITEVCEVVAQHVNDCLSKSVHVYLNAEVQTHVVEPALSELRSTLVNRMPLEFCYDKSQLPCGLVSRGLLEGVHASLEQRRREAIRAVIGEKFSVTTNLEQPLPKVDAGMCDLEDLSQAIEQVSLSRSFTADDVLIVVNQLCKAAVSKAIARLSLDGLHGTLVAFRRNLVSSWADYASSGDAVHDKLPGEVEQNIEHLRLVKDAAVRSLNLLDSLM